MPRVPLPQSASAVPRSTDPLGIESERVGQVGQVGQVDRSTGRTTPRGAVARPGRRPLSGALRVGGRRGRWGQGGHRITPASRSTISFDFAPACARRPSASRSAPTRSRAPFVASDNHDEFAVAAAAAARSQRPGRAEAPEQTRSTAQRVSVLEKVVHPESSSRPVVSPSHCARTARSGGQLRQLIRVHEREVRRRVHRRELRQGLGPRPRTFAARLRRRRSFRASYHPRGPRSVRHRASWRCSGHGGESGSRDGSPHVASARSAHARYGAAANDGTAAPATTASENAASTASPNSEPIGRNPSSAIHGRAGSAAAAASAAATAASVACAPTRVRGSPMVSAATSAAATRCRKSCAEAKHARAKNGKKSARFMVAVGLGEAQPSQRARAGGAPGPMRSQRDV